MSKNRPVGEDRDSSRHLPLPKEENTKDNTKEKIPVREEKPLFYCSDCRHSYEGSPCPRHG